jgi:hypothetical protein
VKRDRVEERRMSQGSAEGSNIVARLDIKCIKQHEIKGCIDRSNSRGVE